MEKCPHCDYEINSFLQNNLELLCTKCGMVCESFNIQNENNKIIEEKGVAKRIFLNSYNPTFQHYILNFEPNNKRNKKIKDLLRLCEMFTNPLKKDDREEIESQLDKYFKNSKETCHNLKALVASAFYTKCNENKRFIKLKDFLKLMNIKNKHFLKYMENFKKVLPQKYMENNQSDFDEIFEKLFQKLSIYLTTQRFDQKKFNMISSLFKPPSNFSSNHKNLFFVKFGESSECMNQAKKLVYKKANFLFTLAEIQFLKNGKSPMNFVSALIVIILKSFDLKLNKNEFSSLFEITSCTLSRIMKEIEQCILEKYEASAIENASSEGNETKTMKSEEILLDNSVDNDKKNYIQGSVSKSSKKQFNNENQKKKWLLNSILKNIQNINESKQEKKSEFEILDKKNENLLQDIINHQE